MRSIDQNARKLNRLAGGIKYSLGEFDELEVDTKVELIRALIPLGLMAVGEMLEAVARELAGARYSRGGENRRHGSNPGTVKLQGQRHRVRVPGWVYSLTSRLSKKQFTCQLMYEKIVHK